MDPIENEGDSLRHTVISPTTMAPGDLPARTPPSEIPMANSDTGKLQEHSQRRDTIPSKIQEGGCSDTAFQLDEDTYVDKDIYAESAPQPTLGDFLFSKDLHHMGVQTSDDFYSGPPQQWGGGPSSSKEIYHGPLQRQDGITDYGGPSSGGKIYSGPQQQLYGGPSSDEEIYSDPLQELDGDQSAIADLQLSRSNLLAEFSKLNVSFGRVASEVKDVYDWKMRSPEITGLATQMSSLVDEVEAVDLQLKVTILTAQLHEAEKADDRPAYDKLSEELQAANARLEENTSAPVNKKRSLANFFADVIPQSVTCFGQSSKQTDNPPVNPKYWRLDEIKELVQAVENLMTLHWETLGKHMGTVRRDLRHKWRDMLKKADQPVDKRVFLNNVVIDDDTLQKVKILNAAVLAKMAKEAQEKREQAEQERLARRQAKKDKGKAKKE